mmetsp:Transcript_24680/g.45841  ORF Transcript_24680/g.45841 Transcript_24680/m.45841 type:complete len:275 (-) Transcript_24680:692-1516(-)
MCHTIDDLLQSIACFVDQLAALRDLLSRGKDQFLDLVSRFRGSLCKRSHFGCNHCKSATRFTRSGGFHAGVQCQKVGLEGDIVDYTNDRGDFVRALFDIAHGFNSLLNHLASGLRLLTVLRDAFVGVCGMICSLFNRHAQSFDRRGRFLQGHGLRFGALGLIYNAFRNLLCAGAHRFSSTGHGRQNRFQVQKNVVEVFANLQRVFAQFRKLRHVDWTINTTIRNFGKTFGKAGKQLLTQLVFLGAQRAFAFILRQLITELFQTFCHHSDFIASV